MPFTQLDLCHECIRGSFSAEHAQRAPGPQAVICCDNKQMGVSVHPRACHCTPLPRVLQSYWVPKQKRRVSVSKHSCTVRPPPLPYMTLKARFDASTLTKQSCVSGFVCGYCSPRVANCSFTFSLKWNDGSYLRMLTLRPGYWFRIDCPASLKWSTIQSLHSSWFQTRFIYLEEWGGYKWLLARDWSVCVCGEHEPKESASENRNWQNRYDHLLRSIKGMCITQCGCRILHSG